MKPVTLLPIFDSGMFTYFKQISLIEYMDYQDLTFIADQIMFQGQRGILDIIYKMRL